MLFVGDDWAEDHHDVEVVDESGRRLARRRLPEGTQAHYQMICPPTDPSGEPNFVTDLGINATQGELERIGVWGDRQQYAIQFSRESAFNSGVRPGLEIEVISSPFQVRAPSQVPV